MDKRNGLTSPLNVSSAVLSVLIPLSGLNGCPYVSCGITPTGILPWANLLSKFFMVYLPDTLALRQLVV
jgi:hypothetical protein